MESIRNKFKETVEGDWEDSIYKNNKYCEELKKFLISENV